MSSSRPFINCTVALACSLALVVSGAGLGCSEPATDVAADAVSEVVAWTDGVSEDSASDIAADVASEVATTDAAEVTAPESVWDPEPQRTMQCAPERAAPLFDALLMQAGLTRATLTFSPEDYAGSRYFADGLLDDAFRLPSFRAIQGAPLQAGCFADEAAAALDDVARGGHPVAAMIRRSARDLDRALDGPPVLRPIAAPSDESAQAGLAHAIGAACEAAGQPWDAPVAALAALPDALARDLTPIFVAMADALAAHRAMVADAPILTPRAWVEEGGMGMVPIAGLAYLSKPKLLEHLEGRATLPALFLGAARVAYAIESVDWSRYRGLTGVTLDLATPIGRILIRDAAIDTYPAAAPEALPTAAAGDTAGAPTWFLLDTGGSDVHYDDVGATTVPTLGVSVAIDLAGDDSYGYEASIDPASGLVQDDDGRRPAGDPASEDGAITKSRHGRQGAGRHGVGMLFDLGGGNDRYDSLAASQGYAHLGVGVLFDDGGSDHYTSEVASQGAAMCGIGLLVDLGSAPDTYRMVHRGQGFAGIRGLGILFDAGGDDVYEADPGPIAAADPSLAPQPLYLSQQMAGQANTSMAQGASTGLRWDAANLFLSGGRGILRDVSGDDDYRAGLFAQGAGYWQGIGLLSDGAGRDHYDALYYVQGAGAHYAVGLLMDGGPGGDWFNQTLAPQYVQVGSGHDFTLGMLVNEAGDDVYSYAGLAAGASNCNGIGIFVDNAGDDSYSTTTDYSSGLGNVSDECAAARPLPKSVGLMLDAGGRDAYTYPASTFPVPSDGGTWGHVTHDLPSEYGAGRDDEGESGLHAP